MAKPTPAPVSAKEAAKRAAAAKVAAAKKAAADRFKLKSVSSVPKSGKVPAGYFKGFNGSQGIDPKSPKG